MHTEVRVSHDQVTLVLSKETHMFDVSCMNSRRKDSSDHPMAWGPDPLLHSVTALTQSRQLAHVCLRHKADYALGRVLWQQA
jgi:hypothetical protein